VPWSPFEFEMKLASDNLVTWSLFESLDSFAS